MERIVARDNLRKALAQVRRNKGAPGVDVMSVEDLAAHLKDHWPAIRDQLLHGTYRPQPVRRGEIPKATGGTRALGVPTVLDRFIQQAGVQVLQAEWDPTFAEASFGFRPGRSAHRAPIRVRGVRVWNDRLAWLLVTTRPVESLDQALEIVSWYTRRWIVEEFHKAWKTGCRAEERRLTQADRLVPLLGALAIVAVRLLT